MGLGRGRRGPGHLRRDRHGHRLHDRGDALRVPGGPRRLAVDRRGRVRHVDDLLDARHRPGDRQRAARQAVRGRRAGPGGGGRDGAAGGRPGGPGDHGVLLRQRAHRPERHHRAADRLHRGHHRRRRARLADLPRRGPVQPRQVLPDHRRAAGVRRRRHPRLRAARPAGGRRAARPELAGLRPVRADAGGLLVRRAGQGPAQLLRPDDRAAGDRLGRLRRRRADAVPHAPQGVHPVPRPAPVPAGSVPSKESS